MLTFFEASFQWKVRIFKVFTCNVMCFIINSWEVHPMRELSCSDYGLEMSLVLIQSWWTGGAGWSDADTTGATGAVHWCWSLHLTVWRQHIIISSSEERNTKNYWDLIQIYWEQDYVKCIVKRREDKNLLRVCFSDASRRVCVFQVLSLNLSLRIFKCKVGIVSCLVTLLTFLALTIIIFLGNILPLRRCLMMPVIMWNKKMLKKFQ